MFVRFFLSLSALFSIEMTYAFDVGYYKGENSTHKCEVGLIGTSPLKIRHYRCKTKGATFYQLKNGDHFDSSYEIGEKSYSRAIENDGTIIKRVVVTPATFSYEQIESERVYHDYKSWYYKEILKQKVTISYLDQTSVKFDAVDESGAVFNMILNKVSIAVPDVANFGPYADKLEQEGVWQETGKLYKCSGQVRGYLNLISVYQILNANGEIGYYLNVEINEKSGMSKFSKFYFPVNVGTIDQSEPNWLVLKTKYSYFSLQESYGSFLAFYKTSYEDQASVSYDYKCKRYGFSTSSIF